MISDLVPAILASMLDIVLVVDPDGAVTYANSRLPELTGFDPEEIVGQGVFRLVENGDLETVQHRFEAVQLGEDQEFEAALRQTDGSRIPCLIAASPIVGMESYLFVVRDLTEAKSMQAQLLQAEKSAALGRLVAGAAHELNNPLTAVLGFAQILQEEADDEDLQADLDRIVRGAMRARRIVQDLLAFARQQSPVRSAVDVNETLRGSFENISRRIRRSKVTLEPELDSSLPEVQANAHQLKLVWDNIMSNACQAMAPQGGGDLRVSSTHMGDVVRVMFSDTGPGIPMAHMSRIFDPFFTTKGVGEGVGLGLSLCQGIIESHGGQLWAESTGGEGATFIVELPSPPETTAAE
ncbi:MAG: Signal transduction histidine-protein kinase AtoS [Anaerolineales bacterium]|nr:Signal transduction histidine-protein kinase AtoS [Anaerolineales bacterium]